MNMTRWVVPLITLLLIAGCGSKVAETEVTQLPEVNTENCLPEKVAELKTQAAREKFSGLCLRQSRFKASEDRAW
jgi:entry exclusion lipoprotein TrbK